MGKILLTGASGFLGKYIRQTLQSKDLPFITAGRSASNHMIVDFAVESPDKGAFDDVDVVVHAAGKAHVVPRSKEDEQEMYQVNTQGTINLLNALNPAKLKSFIFISTVSVYGRQQGEHINEGAELLAQDSYGKSKIAAEEAVQEYCKKHHINCCILRLPLIAGEDPPGNLGAMIKVMQKGRYFRVGKANARKSIVWAKDVAELIPRLQQSNGIFNLTDGEHPTFADIENHIAAHLKIHTPRAIPIWIIRMAAWAGDCIGKSFPINSSRLNKITSTLTFSDLKAREELQWQPHAVTRFWTDII
jgi:nucleoside-diphosphate-sugar epimerase